jgi:sulfur carrier protein ThiS
MTRVPEAFTRGRLPRLESTMRDGKTRATKRSAGDEGLGSFLERWRAILVIITGDAQGAEHVLDQSRVSLGRGPGVDLSFNDSTMSSQHAALEFRDGGYVVRDLGSTNGTFVNGGRVQAGELKNGDRLEIGENVLQFVLEERERRPKTYVLPEG